jgi:hypothetical protein
MCAPIYCPVLLRRYANPGDLLCSWTNVNSIAWITVDLICWIPEDPSSRDTYTNLLDPEPSRSFRMIPVQAFSIRSRIMIDSRWIREPEARDSISSRLFGAITPGWLRQGASLKRAVNFRISRGRRRRQPQKLFRQRAVVVNKFKYDWLAGWLPLFALAFSYFHRVSGWSPGLPASEPIPVPGFRACENTRPPSTLAIDLALQFTAIQRCRRLRPWNKDRQCYKQSVWPVRTKRGISFRNVPYALDSANRRSLERLSLVASRRIRWSALEYSLEY